ncbi:unnamed protein product [Effrenium voratum]|uniref:Uncharacterized protein n=1 Tax=Effrenium voratum TaxID=2562239 RepID=A0AA36NJJ1_9DINO|nr:unnamed protein product [Effrenium voratum]
MAESPAWELAVGVVARHVPHCGVAAFAAKEFQAQEVVLQEEALFVSAVATPVAENEELYRALLAEQRRRRLPDFAPNAHLGALAALRRLGARRCQELLESKCCGSAADLPEPRLARQEAGVLRSCLAQGLLPPSASLAPLEYAKLRLAIQLNGFRFNLNAKEGDFGYDKGEVLFDNISDPSCDYDNSFGKKATPAPPMEVLALHDA